MMSGLLRTRSRRHVVPECPDHVTEASRLVDRGLVAQTQRDRDAFAALYRRYFDAVYWYCFGRLREAAAAINRPARRHHLLHHKE